MPLSFIGNTNEKRGILAASAPRVAKKLFRPLNVSIGQNFHNLHGIT
ncbi:Hypothetical protein EAG7_03177 [Klebsiella aerogenes]|nr:Hypothetical protein EAG7_03177 [Klebsiella aerogenes]CCG31668.1 hypothetical protein [Klebsiella aerogenes EA1509E]